MHAAIADLVMLAHFAFLVVLVLGGFAAWRWPRFIAVHVGLAVWGVLNAVVKVPCPLTDVEDWARLQAGEQGLPRGFIDRYLTGVVYPEEHLTTIQIAAACMVVVSWIGFVVRWRRRRRRSGLVTAGSVCRQHPRRGRSARAMVQTVPRHRGDVGGLAAAASGGTRSISVAITRAATPCLVRCRRPSRHGRDRHLGRAGLRSGARPQRRSCSR